MKSEAIANKTIKMNLITIIRYDSNVIQSFEIVIKYLVE